ncbi:MAG TPA: Hsp70 family protein [Bryobacteraceae bacterium]|jgi:molecular chaperone DnaK (HSP70)|nr:Hsp70 family protein [Bryobacteraceae bacterium]
MNIGIDLGTTNSALAFIDTSQDDDQAAAEATPAIQVLDVPQYVAQGRIEPRRTLPSFLYLAGPKDDQQFTGVYAREQGALVPTQCVHSAKSWLSNSDVDRTAKILPWDAQEAGRLLSPVEASSRILKHLADAWSKAHGSPVGEHPVVLTVPASFDEEARELTVMAAREAGIEKLTLLEEPAAAFYSWIANDLARSQKSLFDGQNVLICDVGGGTSDFTLIRVTREGDRVDFTRTAVGKHLLLGGDNLDLTLAWLVESKLGKQLSIRQRSALRRQCAAAKEKLLSDPNLKSVEITVLGGGSSLVGGTLKTEILRDEVLELALDGFLPVCERTDQPQEDASSPYREVGLPLVADPAVTRHLAAFLESAGDIRPDAILFNGGFFIPEVLRQRVADVMEHWYGHRPVIFENRDLDLAVAVGAAYYSYVRSTGAGLLVRGGLPRAYFIGLAGSDGDSLRAMCLAPRGTEEGSSIELDPGNLQLVANKPVAFRLYSSRTRTEDRAGDVITFSPGEQKELHLHAPLHAVLRFGKAGERLVPVKLGAKLTEVGTLEIWAESKTSEHRWRLQFELRKAAAAQGLQKPAAVISEAALRSAETLIPQAFATSQMSPEQLPARLEQTLGLGRNSWPVSAIRTLADRMLELADGRSKSAAHELRWLNLCGFCLRPGFGFPGDDFRIEQARRVYASGLQFANQIQNEIEWWIFWGRVAGGLNKNQQTDLFQRLSPVLLPRGSKRPRVNPSLLREMWRAAASLELLPIQTKTQLGDELMTRVLTGEFAETGLWCIARLGARKLFYGPMNQVLPPATAARWAEQLLKAPKASDALASLARQTGDATRDLPASTLSVIRRTFPDLELDREPQDHLAAMGRIFGEDLPSGLVFKE